MDVMDYIIQQAYILIPVLYVIGMILKKTPKIPDWVIPWILLALGMAGGFFLDGMKLEGILQGVLVTGVTVFANQLYVQTAIKRTVASNRVTTAVDETGAATEKTDTGVNSIEKSTDESNTSAADDEAKG